MKKQQPQRGTPAPTEQDALFKHAPFPDPSQAVESGEPTLTGDEVERLARGKAVSEPDEGAHWESGQSQTC